MSTPIAATSLIRGLSNINSAFAALSGKRADLIAETNLLLVSTIVHVHEHGDVTVLNSWATAFPAKSTGNAQVMGFIKAFAPAKFNKETGEFKFDKGARVAEGFVESEKGQLLLASSYHTYGKEKVAKAEKVHNAPMMTWTAVANLEKSLKAGGVALEGDALAALNMLKDAVKQQAMDFVVEQERAKQRAKVEKQFG